HQGQERKVRESNPHSPGGNRVSTAARPTVSGYLPYLEVSGCSSHRTYRTYGTYGTYRKDHHSPLTYNSPSGPPGTRTPISSVRGQRLPVGPAAHSVAEAGFEPASDGL